MSIRDFKNFRKKSELFQNVDLTLPYSCMCVETLWIATQLYGNVCTSVWEEKGFYVQSYVSVEWIPSSVQILHCLRRTPYIPSLSLSLCLLFSEVYWLFRSEAKMRRFRLQPQKQPAIRGIFISIHGVSVSACLKEREKGVSTLCSHSPVQQQHYHTLLWGWRTEHRDARFWCGVCVCVYGAGGGGR